MFWTEEAIIWVGAALALIGYALVISVLLLAAIREWRPLRGVGISARTTDLSIHHCGDRAQPALWGHDHARSAGSIRRAA
jgi:hypothetical protein